ncbi:MAG: putative ester cyclase, partial [Candidatus Promineifilaceae bacterium]
NLTDILSVNSTSETPAMRGFDPQFRDIVDYIIKITHEIWEERAIGALYDYYATALTIHTSDGDIVGRDKVIEGTIQTLAAFPDRRLYGDEVIWAGNDDTGWFSSHRLIHEGHNWGASGYGPATGKKVTYRAIADCAVKDNIIYEEWLVRDELSLVTQLGFNGFDLAKRLASKDQQSRPIIVVPSETDRLRGQRSPEAPAPFDSEHFSVEQLVKTSIHQIWNWRLLNKVSDYYAENYICEGASGRHLYGRNAYINYILSLLSPFPDLSVQVDHHCSLQQDEHTHRAATRWTMRGTHKGPGVYGEPTGKQIQIIGVTHHLIVDGKFVQEWTVFDELALLKQIAVPTYYDDYEAPF